MQRPSSTRPGKGETVRLVENVTVAGGRRYCAGSVGLCISDNDEGWNRFMQLVSVEFNNDGRVTLAHIGLEKVEIVVRA